MGLIANNMLLPYKLKPAGWLLVAGGIATSIARFYFGLKLDWLNVKVFAIYSQFLETKWFSTISNNITEEMCGIFLLVGLLILALSAENKETTRTNELRLNAFIISTYADAGVLMIALLFFYGFGFLYVALFNLYSWFFIYIIVFKLLIMSDKRKPRTENSGANGPG